MTADLNPAHWTFGAEHELVDWPRDRRLPAGCTALTNEYSIVNSTGVATDATQDAARRLYHWGHEVNTPPTATMTEQVQIFSELLGALPEATVNFRSELNLHIRVPGLREDLDALKRLAAYNEANLRWTVAQVAPLPRPERGSHTDEEWAGELRNWRSRRGMQHVVLSSDRTAGQLAAGTLGEFFDREVPAVRATGRPLWHAQPRAAVNLRQLKQTDTIEFRHFPGTLSPMAVRAGFWWCHLYLRAALDGGPSATWLWETMYDDGFKAELPAQMPYHHWMEQRFRATAHHAGLDRGQIAANIASIEAGTFDDHHDKPRRLPLGDR